MLVTLFPNVMLVRPVQPENALSERMVMLVGRVMLVRLVLSLNAAVPMVTTGKPAMVPGTVIAPLGPLYPVMVMAEPLLVKLNKEALVVSPPQGLVQPVVKGL